MKTINILIIGLMMICNITTVAAEEDPRIHGYSAEGPFFDFYLGKDLNGHVRTKGCEDCKEVTIPISPSVKAHLNNKPVKLDRFILSKHQPSTLHFNREGKLVRIDWHTK